MKRAKQRKLWKSLLRSVKNVQAKLGKKGKKKAFKKFKKFCKKRLEALQPTGGCPTWMGSDYGSGPTHDQALADDYAFGR